MSGAGAIGILAFIVAMLLSIMIHEWGHYITARKFGMKVTEFFLGFGSGRLNEVRLSLVSRRYPQEAIAELLV